MMKCPLRRIVFLLAGCACPLLFGSCGKPADSRGAGPLRWRFAIEETAGSVQHRYALKFKELIEKRSNGEIEVVVYPYGTLGTSDQITELVDMRVVQFAMASPGHLGKMIPEVQVFLLHFVFSDDERINSQVLNEDTQLRRTLERLFAQKRLKLLSIYSEGWQVWTMKKPVRRPEDFRGVKMRVMTSPLLLAAYRAYGASPTPLNYSEVYSALQLNMVDGQENPVFAIQEMSFYEVTDWMIFAKHAPFITTAVTNSEFFESLTPRHRQLVLDVVDELNGYILDVQREFNQKRLTAIRRAKPGMKIIDSLTAPQRAAFRAASRPVREQFRDMTGPEGRRLLELLEQEIQRRVSAKRD